MENKSKKAYMNTQLCMVLPPTACKVMMYFILWQSGSLKLYVNQLTKALKLNEEELQIAVQTLINNNLISIGDDKSVSVNAEQVEKYMKVPFSRVMESDGIKLAKEVTYNKSNHKQASNNDIEDMSESELRRLLLRIESSLIEKQQLSKCVVTAEPKNNDIDSLPF